MRGVALAEDPRGRCLELLQTYDSSSSQWQLGKTKVRDLENEEVVGCMYTFPHTHVVSSDRVVSVDVLVVGKYKVYDTRLDSLYNTICNIMYLFHNNNIMIWWGFGSLVKGLG